MDEASLPIFRFECRKRNTKQTNIYGYVYGAIVFWDGRLAKYVSW